MKRKLFANSSRTVRHRIEEDRIGEDRKAEPRLEESKSVDSADSHPEALEEVPPPQEKLAVMGAVDRLASKQVRVPVNSDAPPIDDILSRILAAGSGHECPPAEWWREKVEVNIKFLPVLEQAISRVEQGKEPFSRIERLIRSLGGCAEVGGVKTTQSGATETTAISAAAVTCLNKATTDATCGRDKRHAEQVNTIMKITGEPEPYRAWWGEVIQRMRRTDGMDVLEEAVHYASECGDQNARQLKGLGPLKHPGKFIASKAQEHLERNNTTLPPPPAVRARKTVAGREIV